MTVKTESVQAAIAAVHDEAAGADETDWRQILALYGLLEQMSDNPMVSLNRAIAAAMVDGPGIHQWVLAFFSRTHRAKLKETSEGISQVIFAYVWGQAITSAPRLLNSRAT